MLQCQWIEIDGTLCAQPAVHQEDHIKDYCPAHINTMAEQEEPSCEHGLSAWLCEGPMHYPTD